MSFWLGGADSASGQLTWTAEQWQILLAGTLALIAFVGAWWSRRGQGTKKLPELLLWAMGLSLLVLAAAEPAMISEEGRLEQGRFVVLVDSSASMSIREKNKARSEEVPHILNRIRREVGTNLEIYSFGEELVSGMPLSYQAPDTDIGVALSMVADRYLGQQLRGVAVITDGIDRGSLSKRVKERDEENLAEGVPSLPGPLTLYQVGQVSELHDTAIVSVVSGGFAFLRTPFTLKADLSGPPSTEIPVIISSEGRDLETKSVMLNKDGAGSVEFEVRPLKVGRFAWQLRTPVAANDAAPSNNIYPVVVKVVRDRTRVLQVTGSPSYDQKFLRLFLKQDPSVDLVSFFILRTQEDFGAGWRSDELSLIAFPYERLFSEDLGTFDLVVFQNFNYAPYFGRSSNNLLQNIADYVRKGGALVMTGGDRSFDLGDYANTPIASILPVKLGVAGDPASEITFRPELTVAGARHPLTRLGATPEESRSIWERLAEMDGFNRNRGLVDGSAILLSHPSYKLNDGSPMPILAVREVDQGRVMSLGVDSSWRWSFSEAVEGSGNQAYLRFWKNSLRWLVADPEDRRVIIHPSRENALLGEEISLVIRTRDSSYESVPGVLVEGKVQEPDGKTFDFSVVTGVNGEAEVKYSPRIQGAHRIQARYGSESVETVFAVTARNPELLELFPDAEFLKKLASAYGDEGLYYDHDSWGAPLLDKSASRKIPQKTVIPLATAPILALLFAMLASLSWWIRRRSGGR